VKYNNNHYLSAGYAKAREGMSLNRPFEIPAGQVLYRFFDSNRARSPAEGAGGPWWLEYEHFQTIKHFALRNGYGISYAARLFAAILYEWSEVNAWVACESDRIPSRLEGPWKASYVHGQGRPRSSDNDTYAKCSRDLSGGVAGGRRRSIHSFRCSEGNEARCPISIAR
jgi:hypothetical protein